MDLGVVAVWFLWCTRWLFMDPLVCRCGSDSHECDLFSSLYQSEFVIQTVLAEL